MFDFKQVKLLTGLPDAQVRILAQTFLTELQDSNGHLQLCFAHNDWAGIRKLAHTLKPSFYLMGVSEAMECIDYFLSLDPKGPDEGMLAGHVAHFGNLCAQLEMEIAAILQESFVAVPA